MEEQADNGKPLNDLERYIEICNEALARSCDRFPYNRIWQAASEAQAGRGVELVLVDDMPVSTCEVTVYMDHIERGLEAGDAPVLRLNKSYLEDVVSNPQKYIDNPTLIDWGWLFR